MGGDELIAGKPKSYWEAMAWFLAKERNRHMKDIGDIELWLMDLKELGIEIPDPDPGIFVEVPKQSPCPS